MTATVKPLNPRLAKYVDDINNTGQRPLPVETFDEDWFPVGQTVRAEMEREGYIYMGGPHLISDETAEGIYVRPDLRNWRPR